MKFKPLTIALCTLGLVVSVPAMRMAIAQTESADTAEFLRQFEACDRVTQTEANDTSGELPSFDDFKGLNLTDEQWSAYNVFDEQAATRRAEVYKNSVSMADPTATLSFAWLEDSEAFSPEIQAAVQAALEKSPKFDQKASLDQEFGQYGEFEGLYFTYVTPEQDAQITQITEDFYRQVQGIMTAEQLPQYQTNLASRRRINEVCEAKGPLSPYRVVDTLPEPNSYTVNLYR